MATILGSSEVFNTANMKPEPDEQIDSLWGQNLADNISYVLWARERKAFDLCVISNSGGQNYASTPWTDYGRAYWRKVPTHDTMQGTLVTDIASGTVYLSLDGTGLGTYTSTQEVGFQWTQSHLNDNDDFIAQAKCVFDPAITSSKASVSMSAWSGTNLWA